MNQSSLINVTRWQERDMMVTGGLAWWKDFICAACFNLLDQRDEIRFYPRDSKLDNTFAHSVRVPSQVSEYVTVYLAPYLNLDFLNNFSVCIQVIRDISQKQLVKLLALVEHKPLHYQCLSSACYVHCDTSGNTPAGQYLYRYWQNALYKSMQKIETSNL